MASILLDQTSRNETQGGSIPVEVSVTQPGPTTAVVGFTSKPWQEPRSELTSTRIELLRDVLSIGAHGWAAAGRAAPTARARPRSAPAMVCTDFFSMNTDIATEVGHLHDSR